MTGFNQQQWKDYRVYQKDRTGIGQKPYSFASRKTSYSNSRKIVSVPVFTLERCTKISGVTGGVLGDIVQCQKRKVQIHKLLKKLVKLSFQLPPFLGRMPTLIQKKIIKQENATTLIGKANLTKTSLAKKPIVVNFTTSIIARAINSLRLFVKYEISVAFNRRF